MVSNGSDTEGPLEKDFSQDPYHLGPQVDPGKALRKIRTAGSITISPELFEKLYLSPQNVVKGDLRSTFANPTPLAIVGFLLSLSPLSADLMGWRGAGGSGAAGTGTYFFFGGLCMVLGGVGEWVMGNTFPFVVFVSFGAFWLGFAATLQPFYNAYGAYSTTESIADGLKTQGFNASFGFFLLAMGMLCFVFLVCSLRTNVAFVVIFATLLVAFALLTAAYWNNVANPAYAGTLTVAAGACLFVTCASGWWILFAILLASLDFPFQLPVGDLSTLIKGASDRKKSTEPGEV